MVHYYSSLRKQSLENYHLCLQLRQSSEQRCSQKQKPTESSSG